MKRRMEKAQKTKGATSKSVADVQGEVDVAELIKSLEKACKYEVIELDGTCKAFVWLKRNYSLTH